MSTTTFVKGCIFGIMGGGAIVVVNMTVVVVNGIVVVVGIIVVGIIVVDVVMIIGVEEDVDVVGKLGTQVPLLSI